MKTKKSPYLCVKEFTLPEPSVKPKLVCQLCSHGLLLTREAYLFGFWLVNNFLTPAELMSSIVGIFCLTPLLVVGHDIWPGMRGL